jgi:hypothetical protein
MKEGTMNFHSRTILWVWGSGIGSAIAGLAHLFTIPLFYPLYDPLETRPRQIFLSGFISTGLAILTAGILLMYLCQYLKQGRPWAWTIATGTCVFIFSLGIIAMIPTVSNAIGYLVLAAGLAGLIPLLIFRQEFSAGGDVRKRH